MPFSPACPAQGLRGPQLLQPRSWQTSRAAVTIYLGPSYSPSQPLREQGPSNMPIPSLGAVRPHLLGAGP